MIFFKCQFLVVVLYIGLWFYFLEISLPDFGIRVMLILEKVGKYSFLFIFLEKIVQNQNYFFLDYLVELSRERIRS